MISAVNLTYRYPGGHMLHFPEIQASLEQSLLITGKSGCGKTTLLHILAGLLTPASGEVMIDHTPLSKLSKKKLNTFRGTNIGIVFQTHHLIACLTVFDNILMPFFCSNNTIDKKAAQHLAAELQIDHLLHRKPARLSTGEQQRVCIARALVHKPKVLLADEPTSSLDDDHAAIVLNLLQQHAAMAGATLLIVTHDERVKMNIPNSVSLT
ncbi:MAG TPA: ATP-binding cassette domain-containing protein [Lacibacter sp.]|nr:ATP-binding cassette domain-containing protein [Lacibacter sp.]HMO87950.1 ATP-binding cassette domain-containing protein [Lacibacter sp.]